MSLSTVAEAKELFSRPSRIFCEIFIRRDFDGTFLKRAEVSMNRFRRRIVNHVEDFRVEVTPVDVPQHVR